MKISKTRFYFFSFLLAGLALVLGLTKIKAFADNSWGCNSSYFLINNSNGQYTWQLQNTGVLCYPGEYDPDSPAILATLEPGRITGGKVNGGTLNGFSCEVTYTRTDNPAISFTVKIEQDFCGTSATNTSSVTAGNQYITMTGRQNASQNTPGDVNFVINN